MKLDANNLPEFEAGDFAFEKAETNESLCKQAERQANAMLREFLEKQATVYGRIEDPRIWGRSMTGWGEKPNTHVGYLVGVKGLPR